MILFLSSDWVEGTISYVCEIGNTTANEQNLAFRADWGAEHEIQNSPSVVEGLGLRWGTRVLSVVSKLIRIAGRSNGISVDNGGTASGN